VDPVAIVGGGVVGLASALFLARRGHEVVVLERDGAPPSPDGTPDDDFERWKRPGVPQVMHAHAFLARTARVLRAEAPDLLEALAARGVRRAAISFGEGYEDDTALLARRLVFEAVVRRAVETEPGVIVRSGVRVTGLVADPVASRPAVRGVQLDGGERLPTGLVVDCAGRRSHAPRWLREIGAAAPVEAHHPCHVVYFARHYRLRAGCAYPTDTPVVPRVTPYGPFIAFGGDNGTFALGVALSTQDPYRAAMRDGKVLDRVFSAIPGLDSWMEAGEPITDVHPMAGLANRRRSLVRDGAAVVDGYVLVGDSSIYTNASLGQGISLGLWQAQHLAHLCDRASPGRRTGRAGGTDGAALALDLEQWTDRTLGGRFAGQAAVDQSRSEAMRDGVRGAPTPEPGEQQRPLAALMALAMQGDDLALMWSRRMANLLAEPQELFADPHLSERIRSFLATNPSFGGDMGPLPRPVFEALVT
jgi:2-polyprenyl-6-methoxyphenol hydroxylase-like FAD-dependent oxidoreductase